MNLTFETNFLVLPKHANHHFPLMFGGEFFSEMDLCAVSCVERFLKDSPTCTSAITHKFTGEFLKPPYVGDLIYLEAEILETRNKSIRLNVTAKRDENDVLAKVEFVYISIKNADTVKDKPEFLPYENHKIQIN